MEVRNCKGCGKIFNYIGGMPMCEACKKELEDKFQQVKAYIYDNRDADINQVAEDNDVSVQQIRQWVREERLEFSENSRVGLACEKCGRMIRSGRYCKPCKDARRPKPCSFEQAYVFIRSQYPRLKIKKRLTIWLMSFFLKHALFS